MTRIRQFEKRATTVPAEPGKGTTLGTARSGRAGLAGAIGPTTTRRDHRATTRRPGHPDDPVMATLGENGLMRSGSMTCLTVSNGVLGSYAISRRQLVIQRPVVAQYGHRQVTVASSATARTNIGAFHEALNLARGGAPVSSARTTVHWSTRRSRRARKRRRPTGVRLR